MPAAGTCRLDVERHALRDHERPVASLHHQLRRARTEITSLTLVLEAVRIENRALRAQRDAALKLTTWGPPRLRVSVPHDLSNHGQGADPPGGA